MQAPAHSRPSVAKSRLSITADPCILDIVLQTPISTRFNVSAAFRVSVCLSFFAYVSLNYVAILYKSLHVSASKYHPVVLSSSPVCSPVPPPRSFEFFIDLAFSPLAVSHHCIVPIRSSKPILGPILSPWPANESARPFGPVLTFCRCGCGILGHRNRSGSGRLTHDDGVSGGRGI